MKKNVRDKAFFGVFAACLPVALAFGMVSANAQTLPQSGRTPTPANLIDPEYQAKGVPIGVLRLYPTLDLVAGHDDNVFRTEINRRTDTFFEITPRLSLESQSEGHFVALRGGLTAYEFSESSSESRVDWDATFEGGTEVMQGTRAFGAVSYIHTHEPRGYFDQLGTVAEPTQFNIFHADGRVEAKPNRFGVAAGVSFDSYDYQKSKLIPSGTFSNRDRNFDHFEVFGRLSYEFSPGYSLYGHAAYNTREFELAFDRNGVNRDSDGYRLNAGVQVEVTRLIVGEAYIGYMQQEYKAPLVTDDGLNFGANILWSPTPLIDIRLAAAHTIAETVVAQNSIPATDSNQQQVSLGVDYAFRRNIILSGEIGYLHNEFTGTARIDETTGMGVGVTYILNSYLKASLQYEHTNRDSSILGQDYSSNNFLLGIGFQI